MLGYTPPSRYTPPDRYTPPGRYTPPTGTPPNDGHCSGRYTSYWNAFLFYKDFKTFKLISMSLFSGFSYSNQGRFADRRYNRNVFQRRLTIWSCQCSSISQRHGFNVNWQHRKTHALLRSENRVITTDTYTKIGIFISFTIFKGFSVLNEFFEKLNDFAAKITSASGFDTASKWILFQFLIQCHGRL